MPLRWCHNCQIQVSPRVTEPCFSKCFGSLLAGGGYEKEAELKNGQQRHLPFPSLPFPSLPFPSLPFPSLPLHKGQK